jgi:hypothetical protein
MKAVATENNRVRMKAVALRAKAMVFDFKSLAAGASWCASWFACHGLEGRVLFLGQLP